MFRGQEGSLLLQRPAGGMEIVAEVGSLCMCVWGCVCVRTHVCVCVHVREIGGGEGGGEGVGREVCKKWRPLPPF